MAKRTKLFCELGDQYFADAEQRREQVRIREALTLYARAEATGFDADRCAAARWTCFMLLGHWESAWRESDAIAARGAADPNRFWDGSNWTGKDVLVRCLHGLGDTLQFIRYIPLIRKTARTVTVEAQPKLKLLLHNADVADAVITWGEAEPGWQVQLEINELPRVFRTTPETVPNGIPYLRVPRSEATEKMEEEEAAGYRVGLVWAASDFDPSRNVPESLIEELLDVPGCSFHSLQGGSAGDGPLARALPGVRGSDAPILDVARLTTKLDLLLTVDTMNAHLAGALGVRTWTMLPYLCDWRWKMEGSETVWYPNMRLFRQPAAGDWDSVLAQVRAALVALIRKPDAVSYHRRRSPKRAV